MNRKKTVIMLEIAIAVALAFVLSKFKIKMMAQGGSISFEMFPLAFIAFRRGVKAGIFAGILSGIVSIIFMENAVIHFAQPLFDYILPSTVIALCGFGFKKSLYIKEFLFFWAGILRFLSHFISGILYYSEYAPEGQSVYLYSLIYNSSYMIPSIIGVMIIIFFFEKGKFFEAKNF